MNAMTEKMFMIILGLLVVITAIEVVQLGTIASAVSGAKTSVLAQLPSQVGGC